MWILGTGRARCALWAGVVGVSLALGCSSKQSSHPPIGEAGVIDIGLIFFDGAAGDAAADAVAPDGDAPVADWQPLHDIFPQVQDSVPSPCDKEGDREDCDTGAPGICSAGQRRCHKDLWTACAPLQDPRPEVCDGGFDEDCDGLADLEDPDCLCSEGQTKGCTTALPGACSAGDTPCVQLSGIWQWADSCIARYDVGELQELCGGTQDRDCDGSLPAADTDCTCIDGSQNNGETGVDCGGSCPLACDGDGCGVPGDCASGFCVGLVCVDACHNEVQDPGEADVDCGGDCAPCGLLQACTQQVDCQQGLYCTGTRCEYPPSCEALAAANPGLTLPDGPYTLLPLGAPDPIASSCDFGTASGAWTLVQRTVWQWAGQSQRLDTGFSGFYDQSVGQVSGAYRMAAKYWGALAAKKEMLAVLTLRKSDGTNCPSLYHVGTNISFSADVANSSFTMHSDPWPLMYLITTATDVELSTSTSGPQSTAVVAREMLPWFISPLGQCYTCPATGGTFWSDAPHPTLYATLANDPNADVFGHYASDICAPGTPQAADAGGWVGLNVLAFYLR